MTVLGNGLDIAQFKAAQDIEQYAFCVIKNGQIALPAAGSYCDGISLEKYIQNQSVLLRYEGTAKVICGGDIQDSQFIATDVNGHAVPAATNNMIVGKALESGVQGQIIQIILLKIPQVTNQDLSAYAKTADVVATKQFNQTLITACADATVKAAIKAAAQ